MLFIGIQKDCSAVFEEQHRAELTAYRTAAAYFKANNITKLPSPKKLEAEYSQLASMVDKMEPEVAKKALEQFPEFSDTVKTILLDYKELLNKAADSNNESLRASYETCNSIILSLQTELEKDNISFDERKYIIEQMKDIANAVDKKDSENKKWLAKMAMIAGATVVGVAAVLGSVLGANTNFQQIDTENGDITDENT